jgi:hypothetical protein
MADPEHIIDGTLIDDPPMSDADRNAIRILVKTKQALRGMN